jgi:hypothetical protein
VARVVACIADLSVCGEGSPNWGSAYLDLFVAAIPPHTAIFRFWRYVAVYKKYHIFLFIKI